MLWIFFWGFRLLLALGMLYGCFTGLFSREGKYDGESSSIMNTSYVVGIVLALAMLSNLFGLTDVPYVPFI